MKVWLFVIMSFITIVADALQVESKQGVIHAGTWFNLSLQQEIVANSNGDFSNQNFIARVVDQIYSQDFSEILIPKGALVKGVYSSNGKSCSFEINTIEFKYTQITLYPGAYSIVNASLPGQIECNSKLDYSINQQLEFKSLVDINGLEQVGLNKDYVIKPSPDSFVQIVGNSAYVVSNIQRFTNGLMEVSVEFKDKSLKAKLLPVYYDDYGIVHFLNYAIVINQDMLWQNDTQSYLILGSHDRFGFGTLK
ncbi:MAG: hypothetical protein QG673_1433 [Pseudomonadota bacterium]|nr:hypothetical protein [Pseudomonadota bacterium]